MTTKSMFCGSAAHNSISAVIIPAKKCADRTIEALNSSKPSARAWHCAESWPAQQPFGLASQVHCNSKAVRQLCRRAPQLCRRHSLGKSSVSSYRGVTDIGDREHVEQDDELYVGPTACCSNIGRRLTCPRDDIVGRLACAAGGCAWNSPLSQRTRGMARRLSL